MRDGLELSYYLPAYGLEYSRNYSDELYYPVEEVQTSLLRLELKADSIRYVKNVSSGELTEVILSDSSTVNVLSVGARNTDSLTASFTLRVDRCVNATTTALFSP